MVDEPSDGERDAALGAAVGMAARRGLFGSGKGGSAGLGSGLGARGRESEGSVLVTVLVVIAILVGTLGVMFYINAT